MELTRLSGVSTQPYHTGVYQGEYVEGRRHGRGTMSYTCGEVYEGEWREGRPQGDCRYSWPSGLVFEGEWQRDIVIEGQNMEAQAYSEQGEDTRRYEHEFGDGTYRGEIEGGARHGLGTIFLQNGAHYTGQWHRNKKHGQGTYTFKIGTKYVGEFRNDKMRGQGTMVWIDGSTSTRGMPPMMLYQNYSQPDVAPDTHKPARRTTSKECSTMGTLCEDCRSLDACSGRCRPCRHWRACAFSSCTAYVRDTSVLTAQRVLLQAFAL
jgi:hypothetical protein